MKGLILVSDASPASSVAGLEGLRPLLGRPFALHVLEQVVSTGIKEIDVILDTPRPLDYERAFGTGERYGVTLRYHLVRDPGRPGPHLRRFRDARLLALAHRIVNASQLLRAADGVSALPAVWCSDLASAPSWSGWAVVPPDVLNELPEDTDLEGLGQWIVAWGQSGGGVTEVSAPFSADDPARLIDAQRRAFSADFLQMRGTLLPGDIRLGRAVAIDPTARLIGPVFLGDQVRVGAGAVLGPNAFVGAGAVIGRHTVLRDAIVTRRTCVGERLDIENAIASGAGLVHAGHAAELRVSDPFILSPMNRPLVEVRDWTQRALALGLLLVGAPAAALSRLLIRSRTRSALRPSVTPTALDFLTRVWPALPAVIRGRTALIGRENVPAPVGDDLPVGWTERLAALKPGLLSSALVDGDRSAIVRHLSDLTFGATPSPKADVRLVGRYLLSLAAHSARLGRARLFRKPRAWAMPAAARIRN
jgi:NDP-sugar pyrophosphorylase family protein